MKNFKFLFVIFVAVLLSASCNNDDDQGTDINDPALTGSWRYIEENEGEELRLTLTFNANGTGTLVTRITFDGQTETESENFTWSTSGDKLTFRTTGEPASVLTYSISGNELTLIDEDDLVTVLTKI